MRGGGSRHGRSSSSHGHPLERSINLLRICSEASKACTQRARSQWLSRAWQGSSLIRRRILCARGNARMPDAVAMCMTTATPCSVWRAGPRRFLQAIKTGYGRRAQVPRGGRASASYGAPRDHRDRIERAERGILRHLGPWCSCFDRADGAYPPCNVRERSHPHSKQSSAIDPPDFSATVDAARAGDAAMRLCPCTMRCGLITDRDGGRRFILEFQCPSWEHSRPGQIAVSRFQEWARAPS